MGRNRALTAIILALLIPLSGCVSDGNDGNQGPEGPEGSQGIQGLVGDDGSDGKDGINGTDGLNGLNGNDGQPGTNGKNSLISTFEVLPGIQCENGGIGVLIGVDENGNGMLTTNEVQDTSFICHGLDGSSTSNSDSSSSTLLSAVTTLGKSEGCPAGGKTMKFGLDNGDHGGIVSNGILEIGEVDDQTTYCSTQRLSLVADVASGPVSSYPGSFGGMQIIVDNVLYFSANDGIHGRELWAYDLTTDTTQMVADINSGENNSYPGYWLVVVHDSIIYFDAGTEEYGRELWAYDTTTSAYWMVADINPQETSSQPGDDIEIVYGDTIYFSAFTFTYGTELWAHHPANNSTWLVEDIHHGSSANSGWYMNFIHNDVLYFTARDLGNVHDLWAHNQVNGTTWKVASFGMAPFTHPGLNMEYLVGDTIYFDVYDETHGRELMAYNLTTNTARILTDLAPGEASGDPGVNMHILVGDTFYFDAFDMDLWAYSISNDTTWKVHQFSGTSPQSTVDPIVIDNQIFFKTNNGDPFTVLELWSHHLENGSTWMIENFSVPNGASSPNLGMLETINGIVYFDAITPESGRELWAHDSFDGSTWLVANIHKSNSSNAVSEPNGSPGVPLSLVHDGHYYFSASDAEHGLELWKMWFEHTITYDA
ncbi:MAG: hypothetical protein DWC00_07540 [Candidatus Poseidoniales archaeon]|nr:MAG: hypothetical protein DWC00_07540 [Candidatus Poseidoniales archaeon]